MGVRGQVISYISNLRKTEKARLTDIAEELLRLDGCYAASPSPALYKKQLLLQSEHELLMTHLVERQLRQSKQYYFEQGDKAGRLLAQQACTNNVSGFIPKIKLPNGELTADPVEI